MSKKHHAQAKRRREKSRRRSLKLGIIIILLLALWGAAGEWFVHHSRKWIANKCECWPSIVTAPLLSFGNPLADISDGLGWSGHDAVYEYDEEAPNGSVVFSGLPVRTGEPAPNDIMTIDRGEFIIGWSPSLRHPAWVAYHVTPKKRFEDGIRPSFLVDKSARNAPHPNDYTKSGYDRGHMAPNHAIVSRYGADVQRLTFLMSNIAPQSAALNRGVWRDLEHRIADLWTARYGEIWVVAGSVPSTCDMKIGSDIDVPSQFFMVIIAQEKMDIRALAAIFPNDCAWNTWAARNLVTIDELEEITGYDFNPELPEFIQNPLESDLPTRLWPVRWQDILRQVMNRYQY